MHEHGGGGGFSGGHDSGGSFGGHHAGGHHAGHDSGHHASGHDGGYSGHHHGGHRPASQDVPGYIPYDRSGPRRYRTSGGYRGMHSGPAGFAARLTFVVVFAVIAVAAVAVIGIVAAHVL